MWLRMTGVVSWLAVSAFVAFAAAEPIPHEAPDPLQKALANPQVSHAEDDISGLSPPEPKTAPEEVEVPQPPTGGPGIGNNRRKRSHCFKCGGGGGGGGWGGGGYGGGGYGGGGRGGGGYGVPAKVIVVAPVVSGGGGWGSKGGGGWGGGGHGGGGYGGQYQKPSGGYGGGGHGGGCGGGCGGGGGGYPSGGGGGGSWSQSSASAQASASSGSYGWGGK